jgi:hypothetical protein
MIAAIIIIPLLLMSIVLGIAFYFIKKTDPTKDEGKNKKNFSTIQGFIPIKNIEDGYIVLKDGKMRKIIECSSTNYGLKTREEQNSIEMSFQRFLNSLNFPISIFLQTREIDNTKRVKILKEEIDQAKNEFPELKAYSEKYLRAMKNINNIMGKSKEKKKYIIIPFDEDVDAEALTLMEKDDYIKKELNSRCYSILNGLSQIGVKGKVLRTHELIELVYSVFNRDSFTYSEFLNDKEALSNIVAASEDLYKESPPEKIIESSLLAALNSFEIYENKLDKDSKEDEEMIEVIMEKYRDKISKGESR